MKSLLLAVLLIVLSSAQFSSAQVQTELLYRSMDQGTGNTRFAEFKAPFMSEQAFFVWLRKLENLSADISFIELKREQDELGLTHIKYEQHYNGLPIQAAMLIVHIKDGKVESWNGEYFHGRGMQAFEPNILAAKTQIASYYQLGNEAVNKQFLEHFTLNAGFCPIENSSVSIPCYVGDVELNEMNIHEQIWWDARDKRPIRKLPLHISADSNGRAATHYIGTQNITADYISANNFRLRETGKRNVSTFKGSVNVDFYDTDNYWDNGTDKIAGDVHKGAELVHDFLLDYFNRDSYGNKGDTLKSIATSGSGNAFWNLSLNQATFLVGSSGNVGPCASIDVVGHEYGHGIADESGGLLYSGEACALHESFADINGHMIEHYRDSAKANWYIGEEVWTSTMGIRNMEDPHLFKNPKAYGGQYFPQGCHGSGGV